jgi:hypothetical protein
MLTTLPTQKLRLALDPADTTYDALLTSAIAAISSRFDRETNRTLARIENATHEFDPGDTEILVPCYPIESVAKFELKTSESEGSELLIWWKLRETKFPLTPALSPGEREDRQSRWA